jgi:hypothetical protein
MSHYYVILSDSEESQESLFKVEVGREPKHLGLTQTFDIALGRISPNFKFSFEGFFTPLCFVQNDMGRVMAIFAAHLFNVTLSK